MNGNANRSLQGKPVELKPIEISYYEVYCDSEQISWSVTSFSSVTDLQLLQPRNAGEDTNSMKSIRRCPSAG